MVRLTDRPDMTLDVYCGRKTTMQQQQQQLGKNINFHFLQKSVRTNPFLEPFCARKVENGIVYNFGLSERRLVGCFGLNGPLRQYFSLYQAVSQREGERKEK